MQTDMAKRPGGPSNPGRQASKQARQAGKSYPSRRAGRQARATQAGEQAGRQELPKQASRQQPLTTFSISSGTLKLHMLRTARPRMVGSRSLQSFSSV